MSNAVLTLSRGAVFLLTYFLVGALLLWINVQQAYSGDGSTGAFSTGLAWHTFISLFAALTHALVAVAFAIFVRRRDQRIFAWWLSAAAAALAIGLDRSRLPSLAVAATDAVFGTGSMWLVVTMPAASALASTALTFALARMLASRAAYAA